MDRIILHSDMNNFFASVECLYHPEYKDKAVAVSGSIEKRHGIILAKNQIAKRYGVSTGEAIWQAKQKCPDLICIPPHFDRYLDFSGRAKSIYYGYTDRVESFGLDECWLDVTGSTRLFGGGEEIADQIRLRIESELGITASVGVSFNKTFAKLGSDMKKPNATTVITRGNFREKVWGLSVRELLYVGHATGKKLHGLGIHTVGELANSPPELMERFFGQNGLMLWRLANGADDSAVSVFNERPVIKSIGNSTTTPKDLNCDEDMRITMYLLCESVAARLRKHQFVCRTIQIGLRDNALYSFERQGGLDFPSSMSRVIFEKAFELYKKNYTWVKPIRSVGVRACNLSPDFGVQMSFDQDMRAFEKQESVERTVDRIRERFGRRSVQRGIMYLDRALSHLESGSGSAIFPSTFPNQREQSALFSG